MNHFSANKILKSFCFGLLTVSVFTTSLGMPAAEVAHAASVTADNAPQVNNSKAGYVVLALGLLAMLSGGHSGAKASSAPAAATAASGSVTSSTSPSSSSSQTSSASTGNVAADEQKAVNLMNADRSAQGLANLKVDSRLTSLAEKYAQDMVNRNFFSHTNPEGQSPFDRMKQAGISYSAAGENIAVNQNVAAAETAFMNSAGHRANILNTAYTNVGIGVAYKNGQVYVVQEFIKP
ncbi:putative protein YkwD [Sporomusaceae bacterium BoRhaA]|uniref:CAP domain-containing protein n=1 Tax=Pelorhabdus rhamnosifermentans TaxID=2772457 RepID=UPI001C060E24|nr:CAP domain-containing protein [Pelorhabdus rhamnosifermentans]MBU2702116.1 putative protein YkwD [Pelorhabdus rhamnosifermentans]